MKITRITVFQVDLALAHPYWLSGGRLKFEMLDATLVKIETDEGVVGWGESTPWGHTYLPAHGPGVRAGIKTLAPALLGLDPLALDDLNRVMDVQLPGHPSAKSAIDIACWDIAGKASGHPLWRLLGAADPATVLVNSSISTGTPEEMLDRIRDAASKGYTVHSAKIGGADVARDIARIDAISAGLASGHQVTFDVNRAWQPGVAIQVLNATTSRDWVEQPCETLEQCRHVAHRVKNPIMLDECMQTFADHLAAWKDDACEGVKVKPARLGGLTKARRVRDFGIEVGWQMHIEDVGGTVLADTAALHLAASTPDANRLASWLCHDHLAGDLMPGQGARNKNGAVYLAELPGLGVIPDEASLEVPVARYA
ncbi:MAG: mandelate racemase/muconate lactonizing enzyme family protein [Pseudomonadota bacterium]